MVRAPVRFDTIGDELAELIANEILRGDSTAKASRRNGTRPSRQGIATLRSLLLLNLSCYELFRPLLLRNITISNSDLFSFLTLLQRDPDALSEIQTITFHDSKFSSAAFKAIELSKSKTSSSTTSMTPTKTNREEIQSLKNTKEKEIQFLEIELAKSLSTLGFKELPSNESLEKKNLSTRSKKNSSQKIAACYLFVSRGLLLEGCKNLKSLKIVERKVESFGFSFIKRTEIIKEIIKPRKLDDEIMGMGLKSDKIIEKLLVPTTLPLNGLSNLTSLDLKNSSISNLVKNKLMMLKNSIWIMIFLPNLKDLKIKLLIDKLDSDFLIDLFKSNNSSPKDLNGISKIKIFDLHCHFLLNYKIIIPIDDHDFSTTTTKDLIWNNDSEKSTTLKYFLNLTKNLVSFSINVSNESSSSTTTTTTSSEISNNSKPDNLNNISIETLRKGLINSTSTLKKLHLKSIHFPTKYQLDSNSRKQKTKFKSPFISFVSLEELGIDFNGLKSLEPQRNYPDQSLLIYFPHKLRSLELFNNVGFGDGKELIEDDLKGNDLEFEKKIDLKEDGLVNGKEIENQSEIKIGSGSKKKKKKNKSNSNPNGNGQVNGISKTESKDHNTTNSIKTTLPHQTKTEDQWHFLEIKISSLFQKQSQIQSSDSLSLPKNFKTLITPSLPFAISGNNRRIQTDQNDNESESEDDSSSSSFNPFKHSEDLKEELLKSQGKTVKVKTAGELEIQRPIELNFMKDFDYKFQKAREVSKEILKDCNGGMELVLRK